MADATRSLKIVVEEEKKGDGYNAAATDIDRYGGKVSDADLKTKQWAETQKTLQTEISKSKDKIRELHQEVAKTGDVSIFGDIRKEEAKIRGFESTLKALAPAVGKDFSNAMSDALSGGLPGLMPVVIGAVAGLAPLLGAAVAGAVTGVVGIGGVAGGLFAASKDPQVRMAASDLGKHISTSFFASGGSFVEPIKASVKILEKDFDELDLGKTFATAAPYVTEFAQGIGGIATEFMPRFTKALKDGKPAIDLLAQDLPEIGSSLGDLVVQLADSQGAMEGINGLFGLTTGLIKGLGTSLVWLGDRYHDINAGIATASGWMEKIDNFLGDSQGAALARKDADDFGAMSKGALQGAISFHTLGGELDYNAAMALKLGQGAEYAAQQVSSLADATSKLFGIEMKVDDANLAVAQGFLDLQNKLKKGKQDWSDNTQAGIDHQKMLLDQIKAIQRQRDAAVDAANGNKAAIDKANASYETQFQKILAIGKAAGDSQAKLDALAGEYDINIIVNAALKGAQSLAAIALQGLAAVGIHPGKKAAGGPVMAGEPYIVGDGGRPELFVPSSNGYIHPSVPAGGGGNATLMGEIVYKGTGDRLVDALFEAFRLKIQAGYSLS